MPIHDEVDVISVGTAFLRFLEIASKISKPVAVVTDNDGDVAAVNEKYKDYLGKNKKQFIQICFDEIEDIGGLRIGKDQRPFNYNTLEPKFVKANGGLKKVNAVLGTDFVDIDELHKYMRSKKTECALRIFDTNEIIAFPQYIFDAIN